MRFLNAYLLLLSLFFGVSTAVFGQVIDIGDAVRKGEKPLPVVVKSKDVAILKLARRAFELHGGYVLTAPEKSAYVFRIERIDESSVALTIFSGKPAQELFNRKVRGRDLDHSALLACDLAVEATLHIKGFFAGKLAFVGKQGRTSEIYTSDLLFSKVRPLTADRAIVTSPDWSPDGTKLLYTTFKTGFPDIYKIDLTSGRSTSIASFGGINSSPAFSPNGQRIAMSLSGRGNSNIFISNANGKDMRPVTRNKSIETSPSWSPDGRWLVLESDMPGKPQLYEVPASGGSMRRLPTNISGYCSEPAWNPMEKNLIAFTAAVSGGFQIVIYDRQTRKSQILTSVSGSAVEPEWLNDGRHLIFTKKQKGTKRLMLLDSKTKKISALHAPSFGDTSSATFVYSR